MLSKQTLCRLHKNMIPGTSSARSQNPPALGGDNKGPNTLCSESHVENIYAMRPASTVAVSEPNTSLLQGLHFLLPICTCIRNSGQRCGSTVCGMHPLRSVALQDFALYGGSITVFTGCPRALLASHPKTSSSSHVQPAGAPGRHLQISAMIFCHCRNEASRFADSRNSCVGSVLLWQFLYSAIFYIVLAVRPYRA